MWKYETGKIGSLQLPTGKTKFKHTVTSSKKHFNSSKKQETGKMSIQRRVSPVKQYYTTRRTERAFLGLQPRRTLKNDHEFDWQREAAQW